MKIDSKTGGGSRSPRALIVVGGLVAVAALVAIAVLGGAADAQTQATPANTAEPVISGTAAVGSTLTGTDGTWSNSPTSFDRQWLRCPSSGGAADGSDCAVIGGATTSSYVVASGDAGSTLRFRVTASNVDGSASAASNHTAVVSSSAAPVNTQQPTVTGSTVQGQKLTGTNGTWTGAGTISYAYQWVRCPADGGASDGSNCSTISGATASTYTLQAGDVGSRIRLRVTASNSGGSQTAASNATGSVTATAPGAPANTVQPSIGGNARQGSQLVASLGSWSSPTQVTYALAWVRCPASGGNATASDCAVIPGATATTYTAQAGDVGSRLRVRVTATNSAGSVLAVSNATAAVASSSTPAPPTTGKVVPIASVSLPARLIVDRVQFNPNPVRSRGTNVQLRVHVVDTRGNAVSGALVYARSTPLVTTTPAETPTGADGWATLTFVPKLSFPLKRGHNVQVFVRARKAGEPILAGVSTRRLVQVRTAR